jgi:predicted dehydrogenase
MTRDTIDRRQFLGRAGWGACGVAGGSLVSGLVGKAASAQEKPRLKVERLGLGAIGMRYQGSVITQKALPYGDLVAVCDVDRHVREQARASFGGRAEIYEDYRDLIERQDVDVVFIGTPDHWHTKMVVDACRAGKDVYVEKPLTLTVDEGKLLTKVVSETGRVVQVGTWQRSDVRFRLACEMARAGRLGRLHRATVTIDANPSGGPFPNVPEPQHINWDLWLGQAPRVLYCEQRCHYTFRWWYEYSGGKMTDWGAHHVDIAQWGIGADRSGPVYIDAKATFPMVANGYNTPTWFHAAMKFANGVEMLVQCEGKIGVRFEGDRGSLFVTRGSIESDPPQLLAEESPKRDEFKLYLDDLNFEPKVGKLESIENHMRNFFDCLQRRNTPISDVVSQHRSVSTCHLANISMRLGRPIRWDPEAELFVDDDDANQYLFQEQRVGFEVV